MTCQIENCENPKIARMLCGKHYARWKAHGDPRTVLVPHNSGTIEERLFARRRVVGECWIWTGTTAKGYGAIRLNGKNRGVHRVAYERFVGQIPSGLEIDHLCRVTLCFNPSHLEPVTKRENNMRGNSIAAKEARMTECMRGHAFDEENTYRLNGGRHCRKCNAIRASAYKKRRRGVAS